MTIGLILRVEVRVEEEGKREPIAPRHVSARGEVSI